MDSPATSVSRLDYLSLTDESMKSALIEARGDIFVASQLLGITALRLDRALSISPLLQAVLEECRKTLPKNQVTEEHLREAVERRIALYRVTGLDALHDLAAMPLDANSAQNQVKFAAAAKLVEGVSGGSSSGELEGIFRELRETYQQEAPRLRVIREKTTVEVMPGERSIDGEASRVSE